MRAGWRPARIAVGGPGSARELMQHGLTADRIPQSYGGSGLVQEMADLGELHKRRVLLLQGCSALPHVAEGLEQAGAMLTTAAVYATEPTTLDESQRRLMQRGADAVIFSSPAAVDNYVAQGFGKSPSPIACIGPTTAGLARRLGLKVTIEPQRAGSQELFDRLRQILSQQSSAHAD
jgi:uroporphyrinogen-III synthase